MRRGLVPFEGGNLPFGGGAIRRPFQDLFRILDDTFENVRRTAVDIYEEDDTVVVRMDMPGFSKEDIKVEVEEDTVLIEAQEKGEESEENRTYFRRDRGVTQIKELITLPAEVDKENASAKMENGVLNIRLPKVEGLKDAKRVDIE